MAGASLWKLEGRFAGPTLFALLAVPAMVLAFGLYVADDKTFSGLTITPIVNIHLLLTGGWVVLLAAQAWLARTGRMPLHRSIGKLSYVYAPATYVSMVMVFGEQLTRLEVPFTQSEMSLGLISYCTSTGFLLCWLLAIRNRRNTPRHMRYMISTIFVFGTAIVARILVSWFSWIPALGDISTLIIVSEILVMAPLAWMIRRDTAQGIAPSPYWVPLAVNLVFFVGYFTFTKTAAWSAVFHSSARLFGAEV